MTHIEVSITVCEQTMHHLFTNNKGNKECEAFLKNLLRQREQDDFFKIENLFDDMHRLLRKVEPQCKAGEVGIPTISELRKFLGEKKKAIPDPPKISVLFTLVTPDENYIKDIL